MSEYFAGGHLRFVDGEWRDDDGNVIEISTVRHGRWLHRKNGVAYCSECKIDTVEDETNYCPNCGATMKLED